MQIERELNTLRLDKNYGRIKDNLRVLKGSSIGGNIRINDPQNLENYIDLRKNNDKIKDYVVIFEGMLREHEAHIEKLLNEKSQLKLRLFG